MRHTTLLLSSLIALQLSACQQEANSPNTINQVNTQGGQAPAIVTQRDANVVINNYYGAKAEEVKALQEKLQLSNAAIKPLLEVLEVGNIPLNERTARFKELANKYQDLQQRLERYKKTDEFAQQAKQLLNDGKLAEAEKVLEQANEYELSLIKERQKNIAQRTFDLAEISELQLDYEEAIKRYQDVTESTPDNLEAWKNLAELYERIGNSQQALKAWQQLQYYAENQQNLYEYNWALIKEADILAKQGYRIQALDKYQKAHQFFKAQVQCALSVSCDRIDDRDHILLFQMQHILHGLSISFEQIGILHEDKGNRDKALQAYQDAFTIREILAQRDPNNADWQRNLSVSFNNIGDLHQAKGDRDKAFQAFQDALAIRKTLVQRDPNNTDWQRDLSVSFNKIGDMHQTKGDHDKALQAYQDALAIRETPAQRDPNNADWQRDLSISYERIGDLHQAKGDHNKSLQAFQDAFAIRKTLAQRDPNNTQWQRDLMVNYVKMSDVQIKQRKKWLQKALTIIENLHNNNRLAPTDVWIIDELKQRLAQE